MIGSSSVPIAAGLPRALRLAQTASVVVVCPEIQDSPCSLASGRDESSACLGTYEPTIKNTVCCAAPEWVGISSPDALYASWMSDNTVPLSNSTHELCVATYAVVPEYRPYD